MSVKIKLEDGRVVLVRDDLAAVKRAFQAAMSAGEPLQIETPQGTVYINPAQIVSFEHLPVTQEIQTAEAEAALAAS